MVLQKYLVLPRLESQLDQFNGWQGHHSRNTAALVEPLSGQVPGNHVVNITLTYITNGEIHVRVTNITDQDVYL